MDIVEELRQNRESGAKRLVSEYKAGLMSIARRFYKNEGDAEELVNATFAKVVANIDDYLEQSAFFAWMCQILTNEFKDSVRRKSSRMEVYPGVLPDVADEDAQEAIFRNVDHSLLRDAVRQLPDDQRELLLLHYFMDMPVAKIAKFLSIPNGTVFSRLHYARKALAAKLGIKAQEAVKKPGVKATLLALALCATAALGAVWWGELSEQAAAILGSGGVVPRAAANGETGETSGSGRLSLVPPDSPVPPGITSTPLSNSTQEESTMNATTLRTLAASAAFAVASAAIPTTATADDAYIESDGSSVVNSGVFPDTDLCIEIDYALTTASQKDARIASVYVDDGQNAEFYVNPSGGLAFMYGYDWPSEGGVYLAMPDTKRHTFIADVPSGKVYLVTGATTNATKSMTTSSPINGRGMVPIGLFGRINDANGSSDAAKLRSKARIYGARFYKSGALVRNLVPFVKGDAAGFRDTVGGTFHTGECNVHGLSAGGDVERIPDDGFIELTGNDSTKAAENRGGHYINTGYTPGLNTRIEFDYAFAANREGSGDWYALCAGNTGAKNAMALYGTDSSLRICIGSNLWMNTTLPAQTNAALVRRTIILDAPNSAATLLTAGYANFARTNSVPWVPSAMSTTLRLGEDPGGNGWGFTPVRIYGLKIYESDSLVREYVPCVKNGAPGLKYGDTFVKVSWNATNGNVGLPRAGGNVEVSSERDRDAYVLFSGAQNIDTGYVPNSKTKIVVDFGFANAHNNPQQILFDASSDLYCRLYTQNGAGTDAKYSWLFNKAWGVLHSNIAVDHQRRLLTIDSPNNQTRLTPGATDGSTYNGDSTIAGWGRDATSAHSLVLGSLAVPDASKGYLYAKARFYRFTIYDNGEKVREFVPCAANGAAGLYDVVSNEVFTASGLTVGGRGYNGAEEWVTAPAAEITLGVDATTNLNARAVGALRYAWTRNGEKLDESGETLTVEWTRGDYIPPDAYTVTPIYDVFGEETMGETRSFTVTRVAPAFVITVR